MTPGEHARRAAAAAELAITMAPVGSVGAITQLAVAVRELADAVEALSRGDDS